MAYILNAVTLRADNSPEGLSRVAELWQDVTSGALPLLFDSARAFQSGLSPVSLYHNYSGDETGAYDLTIQTVTPAFFAEMEQKVQSGAYRKFQAEDENGDLGVCAKQAWAEVWQAQQAGQIARRFTEDYESTVPREYTKDGKAHCYLYIAVK